MQIREIIEDRSGGRGLGGRGQAFGDMRSTVRHLITKSLTKIKNIKLPKAQTLADAAKDALIVFLKAAKEEIKNTPKNLWRSGRETVSRYTDIKYNRLGYRNFQYARWKKLEEIKGIRWRETLAFINKYTFGQNPYSYWHLGPAKLAMMYFNWKMFEGALKTAKEDLGPVSALTLAAAYLQVPFDFYVMSKGRLIFDSIVAGDVVVSSVKGFFTTLLNDDDYEYEYIEYPEDMEDSPAVTQKVDSIIVESEKISQEFHQNTINAIDKLIQTLEHFLHNDQDIEGAENYVRANYPEIPKDYIPEFALQMLNDATWYFYDISKQLLEFKAALGSPK